MASDSPPPGAWRFSAAAQTRISGQWHWMRRAGVAHGPLRRMTRGPFPLGYLTVTNDFRTLAYFSFRLGGGDVFLEISERARRGFSPTDLPARRGIQRSRQAEACWRTASRMPGAGRALRPICHRLSARRDLAKAG